MGAKAELISPELRENLNIAVAITIFDIFSSLIGLSFSHTVAPSITEYNSNRMAEMQEPSYDVSEHRMTYKGGTRLAEMQEPLMGSQVDRCSHTAISSGATQNQRTASLWDSVRDTDFDPDV